MSANFCRKAGMERRGLVNAVLCAYDRVVVHRLGPGLAKTGSLPFTQSKIVELWRSTDYCWRLAFESADVVSEGAVKRESCGLVYYGTTSVVLPLASYGGVIRDEEALVALRLLRVDPHARVRAVRIACLEARLRAGEPLGRVAAETFVRFSGQGLRLDVEVEAKVREEPASAFLAVR